MMRCSVTNEQQDEAILRVEAESGGLTEDSLALDLTVGAVAVARRQGRVDFYTKYERGLGHDSLPLSAGVRKLPSLPFAEVDDTRRAETFRIASRCTVCLVSASLNQFVS